MSAMAAWLRTISAVMSAGNTAIMAAGTGAIPSALNAEDISMMTPSIRSMAGTAI